MFLTLLTLNPFATIYYCLQKRKSVHILIKEDSNRTYIILNNYIYSFDVC